MSTEKLTRKGFEASRNAAMFFFFFLGKKHVLICRNVDVCPVSQEPSWNYGNRFRSIFSVKSVNGRDPTATMNHALVLFFLFEHHDF